MDDTQTKFDQAYWASQPPEVRALPGLTDLDQRATRGAELAAKGFLIDVPIMVWGWDAYLVMKMRTDYGYTWVPSALQPPVAIAPGITVTGAVPYDAAHPPSGSIKVSLSIGDEGKTSWGDYPPFNPPAQPTPQTPASNDPVGLQSIGTLYLSVPGETYQDGAKYADARGTFLKHVFLTPFGRTCYWEKVG
jgi:hypothetical protein